MQSPVWTVLAKSGSREDYMHDLIFLWKIWNKVANAKQLEYLYGVESTFVGKVFQVGDISICIFVYLLCICIYI
jgi:hypothetical protein